MATVRRPSSSAFSASIRATPSALFASTIAVALRWRSRTSCIETSSVRLFASSSCFWMAASFNFTADSASRTFLLRSYSIAIVTFSLASTRWRRASFTLS